MGTDPHNATVFPGGPLPEYDYLLLNQNTLNAKYEYSDGVARLMAGGSAEHDRIARNTANALEINFRSGPCTIFGSDVQTLVGPEARYFYPDVTLSCDVADRRRGVKLMVNDVKSGSPALLVLVAKLGIAKLFCRFCQKGLPQVQRAAKQLVRPYQCHRKIWFR